MKLSLRKAIARVRAVYGGQVKTCRKCGRMTIHASCPAGCPR